MASKEAQPAVSAAFCHASDATQVWKTTFLHDALQYLAQCEGLPRE